MWDVMSGATAATKAHEGKKKGREINLEPRLLLKGLVKFLYSSRHGRSHRYKRKIRRNPEMGENREEV